MSYKTIKNGIGLILKGLGYQKSSVITSFEDAPANEFGVRYILKSLSGELDDEGSETIIDRLYDYQTWEIQLAFAKSTNNDISNYDAIHRKKDTLIATIDSPSNWTSFARMVKYKSWEVREESSYFILAVEILVHNQYNY